MRSTGFTPDQVAAVLMREQHTCAMAGADKRCRHRASTANHRLNRGAGGTADRGTGKNGLGNACAICDWCNDRIEIDAEYAEIARKRGVKLRAGDDPELIPMWSPLFRQWVQLTDDALYLTGDTDPETPPVLEKRETVSEASMIEKHESGPGVTQDRSQHESSTNEPSMHNSTETRRL